MLDKTFPGIGNVRQNLFLAYVMFRQNHIWDLVVKLCKTKCFASKRIISKSNNRMLYLNFHFHGFKPGFHRDWLI